MSSNDEADEANLVPYKDVVFAQLDIPAEKAEGLIKLQVKKTDGVSSYKIYWRRRYCAYLA